MTRRCLRVAVGFAALLAFAGQSAAEVPVVVPVEGEPYRARLLGITAEWQFALDAGDTRRTLPAADLVSWGRWVEPGRGPYVVLGDGGLLVADILSASTAAITVDSLLFGEITLPLNRVCGIVFQPPAGRLRRDQLLDRVAAESGASDRVILANADELSGTVQSIEGGKVQIETRIGPVEVESHRVRAILYNPALVRRDRPRGLCAWVGFSDGTRLLAGSLMVDEKAARVATLGGLSWTTIPKELAAVQPLGGRATYLSDLKPAEYRHIPYLDLSWPYTMDRNVSGGRLRSGGRLAMKGLGTHSMSRLTYLLAGPYRQFQAELAIDDQTEGQGSVAFRVFVDGQQKYASPIIRGGQPPVPVSIDVAGAKRLDLIVDFADRADELDHANWLNARLIR